MTDQIKAESRPESVTRPFTANVEPFVGRKVESSEERMPGNACLEENGDTLDEIRLLGQPPLGDYLKVVQDTTVDGDQKTALMEWRRANDYYIELEESEIGIADEIEVLDLDPSLDPLVAEATADFRYHHAYRNLPGRFAMVQLDRLVVSQKHVIRQHTDQLQARLGPAPDPETLFRFCQPPATPEAPVKVRKVGSRRYTFSSESTDFRRHEPVLLRPDQICDFQSSGPISSVVGLVVGFGSNYLCAIQFGGRMVLHNGYHRAYAMRALGITHAPCIVKTANDIEDLQIAATARVAEDPHFYFMSKRPPILKDFFDPKIRKVHRIRKTQKIIEIEFEFREYTVEV